MFAELSVKVGVADNMVTVVQVIINLFLICMNFILNFFWWP